MAYSIYRYSWLIILRNCSGFHDYIQAGYFAQTVPFLSRLQAKSFGPNYASALPSFNALTGDVIRMPWSSPIFWCVMLGYVLLTGLFAGSRPAFYLSSLAGYYRLRNSNACCQDRRQPLASRISIPYSTRLATFPVVRNLMPFDHLADHQLSLAAYPVRQPRPTIENGVINITCFWFDYYNTY
jgi:hypothetical protein